MLCFPIAKKASPSPPSLLLAHPEPSRPAPPLRLPTPAGHSVKYPLHSVGETMIASLKQDGVDDVVLEGHSEKAFDLEGAYRHVMVSLFS